MNKDLSSLFYWLKANKLYLNAKKTKLIIFRPAKLKIDPSFKFTFDDLMKWLAPSHSVKYLGVHLDEYLY